MTEHHIRSTPEIQDPGPIKQHTIKEVPEIRTPAIPVSKEMQAFLKPPEPPVPITLPLSKEQQAVFEKAVDDARQREHQARRSRQYREPAKLPELHREEQIWTPPSSDKSTKQKPSTHPFKVSVKNDGGWLASVEIDSRIYQKGDFTQLEEIANLLDGDVAATFSVAEDDFVFLEGAYTDNALTDINIVIDASPVEAELEDTEDDPPETQQTYWRYLLAKIIADGDNLKAQQIAYCHLRILDRFFMNTMVDYPIAL